MPTPSPKKVRSRAPTVDLESSKTRGGKAYSSPQKPAASVTHHALRDVESAESDPFLESAPTTTHANDLESVEPAPQNELDWEEVLGKLEIQNEFLTARNKTLADDNVDLKRRLQESDEKVNKLSPLEERNQHLQNKVAALKESESEQQKVIDRLESETIDASKEVESLRAEVNSLTGMVNEQESIINEQDGIIKLHEKDASESTESQSQKIKAKASKIKDLEDEMAVLKQELEQQVNTNQQYHEEDFRRFHAEIGILNKKLEIAPKPSIIKDLEKKVARLQNEKQDLKKEVDKKQRDLDDYEREFRNLQKAKNIIVTPDRPTTLFPMDSSLSARLLSLESASVTPMIGETTSMVPEADVFAADSAAGQVHLVSRASPVLSHNGNLDAVMADSALADASVSSHSQPNDAGTTFEPPPSTARLRMEDAPVLSVMENLTSMTDRESLTRKDEMPGIEGIVTASDRLHIPSRNAVASNGKAFTAHDISPRDGIQTAIINLHDRMNNSTHPSPLGCGVTSMPDAGNVENVISARLAQDLDASTMEVVTSIPLVSNVDASAMENNGITQLEAPSCEIAQHTEASVTGGVSVEDTTTSPSLAGSGDGSSMRNSPPTGDKECRKNSDIPLLSQVGSSPQRDGSRDSRPKRPESTGKPLRTNDDASGEKAPTPPKGPARANKTENPNSKASGERSDAKLTRKQIIQRSFVENSCEHVPLNFYTGRPDLSTSPYDPYAVILGDTLWEKRFVINDNDIKKLPSRLHEITKGIPEEDDIELIEYLQGNIKPAEICRSGTPDEILISMALRDNDVFICSRFDSIIADIRRFSSLQVLRYIHGQNKFNEIMKNRKLKFSQFDKHTLDVLLLGHRLCSDLEFDEPWMGRRKLLFVYYWSVTMEVRKNFCMRSKLQIRYDALVRHLRDPLFLAKHHLVPSDLVTRLGRDSWADDMVVELNGVFDPWIVRCALGSSLPDPYSSRRTTAVKYLAPKSLGEQLVLNESERATITAQDRMGSVAAEAAEVKEASAPIESNNRFNFDDLEASTASRDCVWTDGSDQVMADEDPKGKKKLAINSSSTSTLLVHAAPALHKATLTAQIPSLESAKSTKIPQKEKYDALFPNTDAVVTPSRTLLPSSARAPPPNYSSPFGSPDKTAVTKIHSNHQYPVLDLPTVDPPRSGDNKNDHSTTASAGTPMPYSTPPRSAKSPPEDTQESRRDVAPARPTNNGTPMAPPSPPRSTQTSCRDTKRRKPSNLVGSPENQQQGVKRKWNSEMIEQINQSPSKRQRWGPFGQYLTPLSSQLDIDIKSFASDLHNNDEYILIRAHRPWTLGVECYSKSILRLQSSEWFDDELINAVSALVEGLVNSRTVLLSSFLYSHLKKGKFSMVDSWVKDLSEDQTRWAFGICENNHWVVIVIDFEATLILYYDPWEEEKPNHARCIRTLEDVKNWVNYLCDLDTEQNQSWQTGMLRGPKQERNDTTSCGPLAGWVLGVLRLGRDVIEGSIIYPSEVVNPLEVRTQFYHRLQAAPRTRRTAEVDGVTGANSDFEEISPEEASKGKDKRPSKSAKCPPVEGLNNSESKQQPPRDAPEMEDSSLSDDGTSATGSPPWMPDPNSPSFGKGGAPWTFGSENFTGQAFIPEAASARKGKSVPPTVRKGNLVDADVNAQTTSSSAPSSSGVTARETGGSAIDAFDDTPIAAGVAVPSTSTRRDIPNEAQNGDPNHCSSPESPLAEQGIGPSKSPFIEMIGETTGISTDAGDIYDVPDDTVESIHQSQKRKSYYDPIYPNKRPRLEGDNDDVAASSPGNAPNTAPSSLRHKLSSVPNRTAVSAKKVEVTIVEPRILASEQLADESMRHYTANGSLWEQQAFSEASIDATNSQIQATTVGLEGALAPTGFNEVLSQDTSNFMNRLQKESPMIRGDANNGNEAPLTESLSGQPGAVWGESRISDYFNPSAQPSFGREAMVSNTAPLEPGCAEGVIGYHETMPALTSGLTGPTGNQVETSDDNIVGAYQAAEALTESNEAPWPNVTSGEEACHHPINSVDGGFCGEERIPSTFNDWTTGVWDDTLQDPFQHSFQDNDLFNDCEESRALFSEFLDPF